MQFLVKNGFTIAAFILLGLFSLGAALYVFLSRMDASFSTEELDYKDHLKRSFYIALACAGCVALVNFLASNFAEWLGLHFMGGALRHLHLILAWTLPFACTFLTEVIFRIAHGHK